jgi:hypothetical protein
MTAEVIETTRHPPIWSVKAKNRYKAAFSGANARAKAEAFAAAEFGTFTVKEKAALVRPQYVPEPAAAK